MYGSGPAVILRLVQTMERDTIILEAGTGDSPNP
jgi:hypothetical protein